MKKKWRGWEITFDDVLYFTIICISVIFLAIGAALKFPFRLVKDVIVAIYPILIMVVVGVIVIKLGSFLFDRWFMVR